LTPLRAQVRAQVQAQLRAQLFHRFALWRGDVLIQDSDWPRPAVRKLCAYFALHAGRTLTRDQLVEDLWPTSNPDAARGSLKTTLSSLRKVIEPDSQSSCVSVEGERYRFHSLNSDVAQFLRVVREVFNDVDDLDVPQVSDDLLAALEGYGPLLPEYAHESWTIAPRENLADQYVRGCVYVAEARLDIAQHAAAEVWAKRAIQVAPWREEAYQHLMRAQARAGQRQLALQTAEACAAALLREMNIPPAPLTLWLMQRLRAGEEI
jgi:DNA-binding SARP family transcriptional activator